MWINYDYTYNLDNLQLASLNSAWGWFDFVVLIIIIVWLIISIAYYIILPYINWYFLIMKDAKKKMDNKQKIQELILMKEVQNELEAEMQATLLNSWLSKQQLNS